MHDVRLSPIDPARFASIVDTPTYDAFARLVADAVRDLEGRTLWSINSTSAGGGVAEMLVSLMGYAEGVGIDARWTVIDGDAAFFALTKRIHNRLHGGADDGRPLGEADRRLYEEHLVGSGDELAGRVGARDVVLVHDPQPAGLIPRLKRSGATVVWRCHIGVDEPTDSVRETWDFLRRYVEPADACVFSRRAHAWPGLERVEVIPPSIDPFSAKNHDMDGATVDAILDATGVLMTGTPSAGAARFAGEDGSTGRVTGATSMIEDGPAPPSVPLVVQVSRWDGLKDPVGVLQGFVRHVPAATAAHLILAGPRLEGVADDPEEEEVFARVQQAWTGLPADQRQRVHLACLPTVDREENAAIVNALQRRSDVVVQKSLAEGFGLTVAEAMWKRRPVVASRVGGIQDQIEHGVSGLLVDGPEDLEAFGRAITGLLEDPARAERIGRAAHDRVAERFLPTRHLGQWATLLRSLVANPHRSAGQAGSGTPAP